MSKTNLLFICSKNQWRSPTAETMWRNSNQYNVRSAGSSSKARKTVSIKDLEWADVILVMGAKPTQAHPVFGSQLKKRLRNGAKLIVADPRAIELVRTPHIEAAFHLPVRPGTNVAFINAMAHVVVREGLLDDEFIKERCDEPKMQTWLTFIKEERNSPERTESITRHSTSRATHC